MILCRVVCALLVTMDSFCRMIALSSVLFPALGFPTMATYPACLASLTRIPLEAQEHLPAQQYLWTHRRNRKAVSTLVPALCSGLLSEKLSPLP